MRLNPGDVIKSVHTGSAFVVEYVSADGHCFILQPRDKENSRSYNMHDFNRSFVRVFESDTLQTGNSPVIQDGWGMVPATAPIVPEDLRRSFEAVARLNNEMYRWTSCMSYNGSYVGEPEGLLKRNIREIERILDRCKSDKGE